jgi:D-lactate dehydrogenase (quinone)
MRASTGQSDIPEHAGALLLIEVDGDSHALPHALDAVSTAARGDGCLDIEPAANDVSRERLWAARKALSPALRSLAPGKINEDVVVPVSRIPELVAGVQLLSREHALPIVCFGHAGNGNLHVNLMYDPADPVQNTHAHAAMAQVFALTLSLGGTLSGEHGIGLAKREFMTRAIDAPTLAAMRAIKTAFDPDDILNPGKLLPP